MFITTPDVRRLGRTNHPLNPGRRHRADFARRITIDAFGWHGKALDQDDFLDRRPGEMPRSAPEARFR